MAASVEVNISLAFLHWVGIALHPGPFFSDIAMFVLQLSYVSAGHVCESCKNSWIDQDADWRMDLGEPKEPCIRWSWDPPREGAIFWLPGMESGAAPLCAVKTQYRQQWDYRQPAAISDRSVSHNVPREKSAPSAIWHFIKILWHLLVFSRL